MNNIEIAANAPTGAKYFGVIDDGPSGTELYLDGDLASCVKVWYLDDDKNWVEGDFDSFCIYGFKEFRSISDVSRIAELEKETQKSNEIMGECWSMVGNEIDFEHGGYSTLHEHVNALKEHADAVKYEKDAVSAKLSRLRVIAGKAALMFMPDSEIRKELAEACTDSCHTTLNKFAIEQQIKALDEFALVPLSVANHHCDKEIAGYMWLHDLLTRRLNELHVKLNGDS